MINILHCTADALVILFALSPCMDCAPSICWWQSGLWLVSIRQRGQLPCRAGYRVRWWCWQMNGCEACALNSAKTDFLWCSRWHHAVIYTLKHIIVLLLAHSLLSERILGLDTAVKEWRSLEMKRKWWNDTWKMRGVWICLLNEMEGSLFQGGGHSEMTVTEFFISGTIVNGRDRATTASVVRRVHKYQVVDISIGLNCMCT